MCGSGQPVARTGVVFNQSDLDQIFQWLEDLQQEEMPILFSDEILGFGAHASVFLEGLPNRLMDCLDLYHRNLLGSSRQNKPQYGPNHSGTRGQANTIKELSG